MKSRNIAITIREYLNEQQSFENIKINENFWKWFGDSKIVENGKPVICYHGSPESDIKIFDITKIGYNKGNFGHYGYGLYFSDDIREAKTYGDNIYKCFIKMENPFYGDDEQILQLKENGIRNIDDLVNISVDFDSFKKSFVNSKYIFKFLTDVEKSGIEYAWNEIHKIKNSNIDLDKLNDISNIVEYTTLNKNVDGVPEHVIKDFKKWNISPKLNKGFPYHQSLHWITDLGNYSKEVTDVIIDLGYDGVYCGSELVIFQSNQIKSIENDGSWDSEDENIYS